MLITSDVELVRNVVTGAANPQSVERWPCAVRRGTSELCRRVESVKTILNGALHEHVYIPLLGVSLVSSQARIEYLRGRDGG